MVYQARQLARAHHDLVAQKRFVIDAVDDGLRHLAGVAGRQHEMFAVLRVEALARRHVDMDASAAAAQVVGEAHERFLVLYALERGKLHFLQRRFAHYLDQLRLARRLRNRCDGFALLAGFVGHPRRLEQSHIRSLSHGVEAIVQCDHG